MVTNMTTSFNKIPVTTITRSDQNGVFAPLHHIKLSSLLQVNPTLSYFHKKKKLSIINKVARPKTNPHGPTVITKPSQDGSSDKIKGGFATLGSQQMMVLCGFGYWVQGFRCFPWLGVNFHMAHNLNLNPSTLQLVQNCANLPMVAKPLLGILSDAIGISGSHRIIYIPIGVGLQLLSWVPLILIPVAREALPIFFPCIFLSNLGASITEVVNDALVAEYGQKHKMQGLQSYALMAATAGGLLGNFVGGYFLMKSPPKILFSAFSALLSVQLVLSSLVKEESLGLSIPGDRNLHERSIWEGVRKQSSDLKTALIEQSIYRPLIWMVVSIVTVPILSGSVFCYQTQFLNLDPLIIGMSKVIGQLILLSLVILYNHFWKEVPMRKLVSAVQILYAASLLLDFILVRQINLILEIPNELFALCFSGLAETLAQFKQLPFLVLFASLCPQGCEGSLTAFFAASLCLSSIVSGLLGVGLASFLSITAGDYSSLPVGILIQFLSALVPLSWIHLVPVSSPVAAKAKRRGMSKRARNMRRIGRAVLELIFVYRPKREPETKTEIKQNYRF